MLGKPKINSELTRVYSLHHHYQGKFSSTPECLIFEFDKIFYLKLAGRSDGWRLKIDQDLPKPLAMGEAGELILRDFSSEKWFGDNKNRQLMRINQITRNTSLDVVGLEFFLANGAKIVVLNWDDELLIASELDEQLESEVERTRYV